MATMPKSASLLRKILEDAHLAHRKGEPFLAVFDLDSTLFDLTVRVQKIIQAFAGDAEMRKKYPEACAKLPSARVHPQDWGLLEGLARAGLFEADHPEFFHDLHTHWAACFFSNSYLHEDQPLPGAVEFVQALERENARIMYLTGRDVERMWDGTVASLRAWRFPLDREHTQLVLKPHREMNDAHFKLEVIQNALHTYPHIWLFENEPVNLNLVQARCPAVRLVFIETTHSGREQAADDLDRIRHFETDLAAFEEFKKLPRS
ncbi:MAG: HAD family hydrolase [Bdellovibrionaceae bacterium]|nr:HAD family hydrolase [Pseudobdellovibrionaceae bacterium]